MQWNTWCFQWCYSPNRALAYFISLYSTMSFAILLHNRICKRFLASLLTSSSHLFGLSTGLYPYSLLFKHLRGILLLSILATRPAHCKRCNLEAASCIFLVFNILSASYCVYSLSPVSFAITSAQRFLNSSQIFV